MAENNNIKSSSDTLYILKMLSLQIEHTNKAWELEVSDEQILPSMLLCQLAWIYSDT